jgi:hypothetical protein
MAELDCCLALGCSGLAVQSWCGVKSVVLYHMCAATVGLLHCDGPGAVWWLPAMQQCLTNMWLRRVQGAGCSQSYQRSTRACSSALPSHTCWCDICRTEGTQSVVSCQPPERCCWCGCSHLCLVLPSAVLRCVTLCLSACSNLLVSCQKSRRSMAAMQRR